MESGKTKKIRQAILKIAIFFAVRILLFLTFGILISGLFLWTFFALRFLNITESKNLELFLAIIFAFAVPGSYLFLKNRWRTTAFFLVFFICVHTWFVHIEPSPEGSYPPETSVVPRVIFHEGLVTIKGIRDFRYTSETDFKTAYYDKTIDIGDIQTVDYVLSYWTEDRSIAHGFVSFGLKDGSYLPVSIEIRRKIGDSYGIIKGLFKQFQLIYIWADERDIIALRTNYRKEDVYLYRSTLTPDECRRLFFDMAMRTEKLAVSPEFYNTLTQNCTSSIIDHLLRVSPDRLGKARRYLFNGYTDKAAFDGGLVLKLGTFAQTKDKSYIDERAIKAGDNPDFSQKIRSHIPSQNQ